jgi:hypothetical protein
MPALIFLAIGISSCELSRARAGALVSAAGDRVGGV